MRNKAHIQYKLNSGTLVPGVTTVLNSILAKPYLVEWAYQCGLKNQDYKKIRDTAGGIGTLAHYLVVCDLQGQEPDTKSYSPEDISKANNCLKSYFAWKKHNLIKPTMVEEPLISEKYGYGGTLDIYGILNDENVLIDLKTSKGIYESYLYQLGAYGQLIFENTGKQPDKALILRINKDNNDDFEIRFISNLDRYFEVFRHLLCVYKLQKELS